VAQDLNFQASSSIEDLIGELGFKQRTMQQASERHDASRDLSLDLLQQKEGVDDYEISARLLSIQTTLQASYETTSLLSGLSLVNFLR